MNCEHTEKIHELEEEIRRLKKTAATWQSNYQKLKNKFEKYIEDGKGEVILD